jgi:hypothetical protein
MTYSRARRTAAKASLALMAITILDAGAFGMLMWAALTERDEFWLVFAGYTALTIAWWVQLYRARAALAVWDKEDRP